LQFILDDLGFTFTWQISSVAFDNSRLETDWKRMGQEQQSEDGGSNHDAIIEVEYSLTTALIFMPNFIYHVS